MREPSSRRVALPALLVCFFLSGAAGLIYQIAWGKALGLIFGHTAYAVATVLAVFMGGLAAGSAWIGKWSERIARPVAAYGFIELGIAATGAASLAGLAAVRDAYVALYPHAAGHATILLGVRFLGAACVLFVPAFLMGGTLPVLVHGLVRRSSLLGTRLARLYWINTSGAVAGTIVAGFVFLPVLGLRRTVGIAVLLNILAGAIAIVLSRGEADASNPPAPEHPQSQNIGEGVPPSVLTGGSGPSRFLLACFAVVGATAMAYEIGWARLLSTQLGSSTYAFTLMLATFLTGIVIGSAAFEWWTRGHQARRRTFAVTQTLTALAALAFLIFFTRLPEVLPPILRATQQSFRGLVLAQFAVSALAMLPAAVLFGFNFPVVTLLNAAHCRGESRDRSGRAGGVSSAVGSAYAWNTFGAIAGATATGFWLLPRLGSFRLLAATAAVNLGLAALLGMTDTPRRAGAFAANVALLLVVGVVAFSPYFYDPATATFNTVMYWNLYERPLTIREDARTMDVVYVADGLNSTISVAKTEDYLALRTNGKVDASNHDVVTQLLVGHIGALAHPAPRRVLVIGFGSGMTLSALARYPEIERLDCVEIEPAVVRAAPLLVPLNRNVLQDPRVHVTFDDGRNFLLTTREHYDLIISEPSNPWIAGVATLFTREFYQAANARLAPGGVFVQWVQAYSLFPDDLRMVLATFLSEFHGATLWHGDAPDLLLVAPSPPASQMLDRVRGLWNDARLREDFHQLGMDAPEGLLGFYLLGDAEARSFSAGAPMNTDDLTLLEYHAPRALLVQALEDTNRREILRYQKDALPQELTGDARDAAAASAVATSLNLDDADSADRFLRVLDERPVTAEIATARGRAALVHAQYGSAYHAFDAALAIDPHSIDAAWGRAEADRRFGNNERARQQFALILERDPQCVRALESLRKLDADFSRWKEAADLQQQLIAAHPGADAAAYAELGDLLLRAEDPDGAYRAMQSALDRDPYNFQAHFGLAQFYRLRKMLPEARTQLEFIQRFFPDNDANTYTWLYEVDKSLGDSQAAAGAARFGLRVFPDNSELQRLKPFL